ncbi:unnamed protein product [Linum tenue]|uniref:Uncharacterized protein n=1 Tax=Linum tenue TaxID=586396 RepID=A0AAV0R5A8_9ROSI|nr:unnamed protein product [Linum tenue]
MDDATTTADKPIKKRRQADGRAPTSTEGPTRAAAPEEEVEEFFAILRRIHVAVKYFERSGVEAGSLLSAGKRRRPSFEKEDFVEIGGGGNDEAVVGDCDGGKYKGAGLDLNSDPPLDLTFQLN